MTTKNATKKRTKRPTKPTREAADAARLRAAEEGPTAQDRKLAATWFALLRDGHAGQEQLAKLFSSIRFDVALVRKLESDVANLTHDRAALEASLRAATARR
jgi:hypothetical protein